MSHSKSLLDSLHRQTEQFLEKAITVWQMLPEDVLLQPPVTGQWSVAQCLEHLNIYGRFYLPAIEKTIQEGQVKDCSAVSTYRPGWLGAYFTNLMRPGAGGQLKSKMKAPQNAWPVSQPDARAMLAEFIDQQEKMLKLLDAARSVNLERLRVPISLSRWIRLQLGDTFSFVIAHIERHVLQAERALQATQNTHTFTQLSGRS